MEKTEYLSSPLAQLKWLNEASKSLSEIPIAEAPTQAMDEDEDDDDDCVICYQTLYRPARTECGHSACESCLLHWALTAMDTKFGGDNDPEVPANIAIAVDGIKFKCPTCRTYTQASFDNDRSEKLAKRYQAEYTSREAEIAANSPLASEDGTELAVLMIGNSHRKIPRMLSPHSGNEVEHEWTFFVKASNQAAIEKVEVILHPTYRDSRLAILKDAPFSLTRVGRNYFTIFAGVVLKEGWEWVGEEMIVDSDADKGRVRDRLPVRWLLDFHEGGSMKTQTIKMKQVRQAVGENADGVVADSEKAENMSDGEDADFGPMAAFMSEAEIAELKEVRRMKRRAIKEKNVLLRPQ